MSDYEFKCAVRAEIKSLRGRNRTEAYNYFSAILGDADDLMSWEGKVEEFSYNGDYQPGEEYSPRKASNDGWFVDRIIKAGESLYLTIDQLEQIIEDMITKFQVNREDIMIVSYSWYNGSDEPRHLTPPQ